MNFQPQSKLIPADSSGRISLSLNAAQPNYRHLPKEIGLHLSRMVMAVVMTVAMTVTVTVVVTLAEPLVFGRFRVGRHRSTRAILSHPSTSDLLIGCYIDRLSSQRILAYKAHSCLC